MVIQIARLFFVIVCLLQNFSVLGQFYKDIRLGVGIGGSVYCGNQMDEKISFSTFNKSEVNSGYNFQIYKGIDENNELGFRYLTTSLWSFKSNNELALNAELQEFSFLYQKSLNNNIKMDGSRFTFNLHAGLGLCYFRSAFYDIVNPENAFQVPFTAIGYGNIQTLNGGVISEKLLQPLLIGGFNIGYRISPIFSIYFENSLSLTNSNKLSGNLLRKSSIPPDGYTYHCITVYINYSKLHSASRIKCPKF